MSAPVVIVGGGLAGISAACHLADQGFKVRLLEKSRRLGGRAQGGNRLTLGCCTSYLQLLDMLGTRHLIHMQERMDITVAYQGRRSRLHAVALPHPWALAPSFLRYPFLSVRAKGTVGRALLRIARGAQPLPEESFAAWLERHRQPRQARRFFWELIAAPTLNSPAETAAAEFALLVFREAVLGGPHTATLGFIPYDAARLLEPVSRFLADRGSQVQLQASVERIAEAAGDPRFRVHLKNGEVLEASRVVAAVPHTDLLRLLPPAWCQLAPFSGLSNLSRRPIIDVMLTYDRPVLSEPVIAIPGLPALWVFPKQPQEGTQRIAVSISCPDGLTDQEAARVVRWTHERLATACPVVQGASLVQGRVYTHRGATFSVAPRDQDLRLPSLSPIAGLFLAGDWTRTGWPATMEGAVRSGLNAAYAVSQAAPD
ncbi:MAG: hydroxysqualene dehydroxylase HpnE [Limnochordia bacterium]|jgi:squalene-associated FAD-dependent desaturase